MARIELADSEVHDLVEAITEIIGDKGREFDSLNRPRYEALLDRLAAFESAQKADRRTGLDLDRFRARARDLRKLSSQLSQLATLPDRVTKKDFEDVSKLMVRGADDLEALLEARLPGCLCRLIENDNYSYLDYNAACRHHSQLHAQEQQCKKHYADLERALKNEARMKLVAAVLTGAALVNEPDWERRVERAFDIADETLRQAAKEIA
jgi:hypothetical protein